MLRHTSLKNFFVEKNRAGTERRIERAKLQKTMIAKNITDPKYFTKIVSVPPEVRERDLSEVKEVDQVRGGNPLRLGKGIPPEFCEGDTLRLD